MVDTDIILSLLRTQRSIQSSWDWEADLWFAEAIHDQTAVECLRDVMKSLAPFPIRDAVRKHTTEHVRLRRLRALRKLVKRGVVESYWHGTGEGSLLGVNRIRTYALIEKTS